MSTSDEAGDPLGRILRMPGVLARTGLSRSTLYRKLAAGTFPKQIQISERCIGWSEAAITAWLRDPAGYGSIR
jgi:prophage regulatory protein